MENPSTRHKRQEIATYRKLNLDREVKSVRRRSCAEASGLYRYIGGLGVERPWLRVLKSDYMDMRTQVVREWKTRCQKAGLEQMIESDWAHQWIERETYDRLASRMLLLTRIHTAFRLQQQRDLTPHEITQFLKTLADDEKAESNVARAHCHRRRYLNEVLEKINRRAETEPGRLASIWAQAAGNAIASESCLEKIDTQTGIAWCRCFNPSTAFHLRHQRSIPKKLSDLTGLRVTKIMVR